MALVNSVFEMSYVLQMVIAIVVIMIDILCAPYILEYMRKVQDLISLSVFVTGSFLTVYVQCHMGQKLMDCSVDVYEEACLIPIHKISVKTQKLLLTTILMNAKPNSLSIGKIFVASHEFFSNILRTSFSYAMVLRSLQNM